VFNTTPENKRKTLQMDCMEQTKCQKCRPITKLYRWPAKLHWPYIHRPIYFAITRIHTQRRLRHSSVARHWWPV